MKNIRLWLLLLILVLMPFLIFLIIFASDFWSKYKQYEPLNQELDSLKERYDQLKQKYEANLFELNNLKNEEIKNNKVTAKKFLTDTEYWMRRTFNLSKENKELRKNNQDLKDKISKFENSFACKITILNKKIKLKAKKEYEQFVIDILKYPFNKKYNYILIKFPQLTELSNMERILYLKENKKLILNYIEKKLYFNTETNI